MNAPLNLPLAISLLTILSLIWVAIGFYFSRQNKNFDDHAVAGRSIGLALGSATAVATWITSNTIMLAPQLTLQMGVWGMLAYSTASLGLFLFAPMASRIRKLMPNGYTSGDFIRLRFGRSAWLIYLLITIFYSVTWLVSMAMAGGILLEALSDVPYAVGMTVILVVCVVYTINGGLAAVIGTDFVQSLIILIGVVVVGIYTLSLVDISTMYENVSQESPALFEIFFPAALMAFFNNLLFGLGEVFHNNVWWSRAFAMREGVGKQAFLIAGIIWLPVPVAAGFIALATGVLQLPVPSADMVGPLVTVSVLGDVGAVLVFIVVFCSLASSIDSLLASISDLMTEDLYRKLIAPSADSQRLKKVSQGITLALGAIVWAICLPRYGTLMTVLFFAGPLVGSLIWPIITGLYWSRTGSTAAITGMLAGSISGLIAYFTIGWYVATVIGTAVSMLCVLYFTWARPVDFSWATLDDSSNEGS
jgi:Na+/proline symporter